MQANTAVKGVSLAGAMQCGLLLLAAASVQAQSIAWSTFLGGSGYETPSAIATDREGNIYVAGYTKARLFSGASVGPGSFLAKLNAAGTRLFCVVAVPGEKPRALAVGKVQEEK